MSSWKIDGVPAAYIMRSGISRTSNVYDVIFQRSDGVTLEQIEKIHWAKPTVEYTGRELNPDGLPEGYGFSVDSITYNSAPDAYNVQLHVAKQYLGDVTAFQAEIDNLTAANTEQRSTIADLTAALAEADELVISLYEAQAAEDDADSGASDTATGADAEHAETEVGA